MNKGKLPIPDEDEEADMYEFIDGRNGKTRISPV